MTDERSSEAMLNSDFIHGEDDYLFDQHTLNVIHQRRKQALMRQNYEFKIKGKIEDKYITAKDNGMTPVLPLTRELKIMKKILKANNLEVNEKQLCEQIIQNKSKEEIISWAQSTLIKKQKLSLLSLHELKYESLSEPSSRKSISYLDSDSETEEPTLFGTYEKHFEELLNSKQIETKYSVNSVQVISQDSWCPLLAVFQKVSEMEIIIGFYEVDKGNFLGEVKFVSQNQTLIRVGKINESQDGSKLAILSNDDGNFFVLIIQININPEYSMANPIKQDKVQLKIIDEIDLNFVLNIDDGSLMQDTLDEPGGTCCFIPQTFLFIQIFYSNKKINQMTQVHLIYNFKAKKCISYEPLILNNPVTNKIVVDQIIREHLWKKQNLRKIPEFYGDKSNAKVAKTFQLKLNDIQQQYFNSQIVEFINFSFSSQPIEVILFQQINQLQIFYSTGQVIRVTFDLKNHKQKNEAGSLGILEKLQEVQDLEMNSPNQIDDKYILLQHVDWQQITKIQVDQIFRINEETIAIANAFQFQIYQQETLKLLENNSFQLIWKMTNQLCFSSNNQVKFHFQKQTQTIIALGQTKIYFYEIQKEKLSGSDKKYKNILNLSTRKDIEYDSAFNSLGIAKHQENFTKMIIFSEGRYKHEIIQFIGYQRLKEGLTILSRKNQHFLCGNMFPLDRGDVSVIDLPNAKTFIQSSVVGANMIDCETFQVVGILQVEFLKNETREPNQVLKMRASPDEYYIAVITGKNLIKGQQKANQLWVFSKQRSMSKLFNKLEYKLDSKVILKNDPMFLNISMEFFFQKPLSDQDEYDNLLFIKREFIFVFNFKTQQQEPLYYFKEKLSVQPQYVASDQNQQYFLIANQFQCIHVNLQNKTETVIQKLLQIQIINAVVHYDDTFFLLTNKYRDEFGLFVIKINEKEPSEFNFIYKQGNMLTSADYNMFIQEFPQLGIRELLIVYKVIYVNTMNLIVLDINKDSLESDNEINRVLFQYEQFQVWEAKLVSILLESSSRILFFNPEGTFLLDVSPINRKYVLNTFLGQQSVLHSFESLNYLKREPDNSILITVDDQTTIIDIRQEIKVFNENLGYITEFKTIDTKIIRSMSIIELLIMNSYRQAKRPNDLCEIVNDQPVPKIEETSSNEKEIKDFSLDMFFRSFLEFEGTCIFQLFYKDSRALQKLLSIYSEIIQYEDKREVRSPLIQTMKILKQGQIFNDNQQIDINTLTRKYAFRSVIDSAIKNNQLNSCQILIDFIANQQNNFITHYIFNKNLYKIIQRGVNVQKLLDSEIFIIKINYLKWPDMSFNKQKVTRELINCSILNLEHKFQQVFPEPEFQPMKVEKKSSKRFSRKSLYQLPGKPSLNNLFYTYKKQDHEPQKEQGQKCCSSDQSQSKKQVYPIIYIINLLPGVIMQNLVQKAKVKKIKQILKNQTTNMEQELDQAICDQHIELDANVLVVLLKANNPEIFLVPAVREMIDWKWDNKSFYYYLVMILFQFIQVINMIGYIINHYIYNNQSHISRITFVVFSSPQICVDNYHFIHFLIRLNCQEDSFMSKCKGLIKKQNKKEQQLEIQNQNNQTSQFFYNTISLVQAIMILRVVIYQFQESNIDSKAEQYLILFLQLIFIIKTLIMIRVFQAFGKKALKIIHVGYGLMSKVFLFFLIILVIACLFGTIDIDEREGQGRQIFNRNTKQIEQDYDNFMIKMEKNIKKNFQTVIINTIQSLLLIFDKSGFIYSDLNSIPFPSQVLFFFIVSTLTLLYQVMIKNMFRANVLYNSQETLRNIESLFFLEKVKAIIENDAIQIRKFSAPFPKYIVIRKQVE